MRERESDSSCGVPGVAGSTGAKDGATNFRKCAFKIYIYIFVLLWRRLVASERKREVVVLFFILYQK